ncbi:YfbU family protein [Pseudomonas sp. 10B1]|uniref:YfbU family protein n=1 Tax=Pseudomonas sp. 10B1 TaxID=3048573 RepID=UPI002B22EFD2|nr:YfbU family protein [Pseudomonas sp. 10B1]MEB0308342.1 YfbU family protein [Pseudomonas sp. 10B1]
MEFTNQQKLILTLLTDIHAKLQISNSVDPDFIRRAVNEGQGWALAWKYPGLFEESDDDPEDVRYVADVLEMWSALEDSFNALNMEGRGQLAAAADPFGNDVKFPGFDGNNESQLLAIAQIFVSDLERWSEFSGRINNSHMRTTDGYKRMLAVFDEIRTNKLHNHDYNLFGVEELAQVLNGRRHPSNMN